MAVVGINYNKDKYESVRISCNFNTEEKVFDSGSFVKDWYFCNKFILFDLKDGHVSNSSSVNHFIMDGAPFESAYLKVDGKENPYLDYKYDPTNERFEYFVPIDTRPTWEELRNLCDDPQKKKQ